MQEKLVGRYEEREILQKTLVSGESEFIAVYGRRRVGKTFLIREFFKENLCFEITGIHDAPLAEQLQNFSQAIGKAVGKRGKPPELPATWQQAFQQLIAFLETQKQRQKLVIFFDELPWLATRRSRFLPALDHFWNSWASARSDIVLIVCGSAASWMIGNIINHRGGLHNRITRRIRLVPFSLAETQEYLKGRKIDLGQRDILELYMAMGGIPHYLREVEPGLSAAQIIDKACFTSNGFLRDEFSKLYASLFEHSGNHVAIVRCLATKRRGLTRNEIAKQTKLQTGGGLTSLLHELEESGFVARMHPFGKSRKGILYRLVDEYSVFYINWVERSRTFHKGAWLKKHSSPAWYAWSGYAFESVCFKHIPQMRRALGIEAVETTESSWLHRPRHGEDDGGQIDLLIDRRDNCINLCEMKFSEREVNIDKRYAGHLRNRRELFREVTRSRKVLFLTMVTTYGVKQNLYSQELITNSITMEALYVKM
ncbi:MAG: ATP-binding protein [Planctomycetota bacterium]|jgi:hypothetical protein|nr:ATP-binding protein [Planctomycetota bacterium]MDP6502910.1 ATP-binding protein [Planctomycetota bacterium]